MSSLFSKKVKEIVKNIPNGATLSYKQVAIKAGNPKASRAVAKIMATNQDTSIPCHRVICSNGQLGGYNGLLGKSKEDLLAEES